MPSRSSSVGKARRHILAVLDEGPGLAEGEEQALFERFARGSASQGAPSGTGLGLAIVQTLAQRWGGQASLTTRPEGGTRAEIRLPAHGTPAPDRELDATVTAPH